MSKWVVDIHGDIEGDYEIIKEYEEPQTGHWIPIRKSTGTIVAVKCECCGGSPRHGHKTDYCPNCGARMESEANNG